jgi:hypothetical protein
MTLSTHTPPADIAALNAEIAARCDRLGLSHRSLARQSGVSHWRLSTGAALSPSEVQAVEVVLGPLPGQRERAELSATATRVIETVFKNPNPALAEAAPIPPQE